MFAPDIQIRSDKINGLMDDAYRTYSRKYDVHSIFHYLTPKGFKEKEINRPYKSTDNVYILREVRHINDQPCDAVLTIDQYENKYWNKNGKSAHRQTQYYTCYKVDGGRAVIIGDYSMTDFKDCLVSMDVIRRQTRVIREKMCARLLTINELMGLAKKKWPVGK